MLDCRFLHLKIQFFHIKVQISPNFELHIFLFFEKPNMGNSTFTKPQNSNAPEEHIPLPIQQSDEFSHYFDTKESSVSRLRSSEDHSKSVGNIHISRHSDINSECLDTPVGFVYSCFKTFRFNSPIMNQNMDHKSRSKEKTINSEYVNFRREMCLRGVDDNKSIVDFAHSVINSSIVNSSLNTKNPENMKPTPILRKCYTQQKDSNRDNCSISGYEQNVNNQKEIFSDNEILERLNLKSLDFSEMPPNPIKIAEASFLKFSISTA